MQEKKLKCYYTWDDQVMWIIDDMCVYSMKILFGTYRNIVLSGHMDPAAKPFLFRDDRIIAVDLGLSIWPQVDSRYIDHWLKPHKDEWTFDVEKTTMYAKKKLHMLIDIKFRAEAYLSEPTPFLYSRELLKEFMDYKPAPKGSYDGGDVHPYIMDEVGLTSQKYRSRPDISESDFKPAIANNIGMRWTVDDQQRWMEKVMREGWDGVPGRYPDGSPR